MESFNESNNLDITFIKQLWELDPEYTSFILAKEDRINDFMIELIGD